MRRKSIFVTAGICLLVLLVGYGMLAFAKSRSAKESGSAKGKGAKAWFEPITDFIDKKPVVAPAPALNQILKWDGAKWIPATDETGTDTDNYVDGISVTGAATKTITLTRTGALPDLTASFTDETGTGVPPGVIVMWSGTLASIPGGWALCDGTLGTPNLSDRFIYGVHPGENPGATGGSTSHSHTANCSNDGAHSHTVDIASFSSSSVGNHTHSVPARACKFGAVSKSQEERYASMYYRGMEPYFTVQTWGVASETIGIGGYDDGTWFDVNALGAIGGTTGAAGSHSHSVDPPSTSTSTAGNHSHTITVNPTTTLPPYYKLAFIMKL